MTDALKKVSPGQRLNIPARSYNAFIDAARFARDRQTDIGGGPVAPPFALQRLAVQSVGADHLVCRHLEPDGSVGTVDVFAAKPWTLRRTPFDGQTIDGKSFVYSDNATRTVTKDAQEETQAITPDYAVDDVIFAAVTDVLGQIDPEDVYDPGRTVLVDANVDGRAWAVVEDG
jgi:hypothetical protein